MEVNASQVEALEPRAHDEHFLKNGVRPDGRTFEACRPLAVTLCPLGQADGIVGSAQAVLGATRVIGCASLQVGNPDLAAPYDGDLGE